MATYISLCKFTDQGAKTIRDVGQRVDAARQMGQRYGATIKDWYLTMGRFDAVVIIEAPDAETAAKLMLGVAIQGNVSTETLPAFSEADTRRLVEDIPG